MLALRWWPLLARSELIEDLLAHVHVLELIEDLLLLLLELVLLVLQ